MATCAFILLWTIPNFFYQVFNRNEPTGGKKNKKWAQIVHNVPLLEHNLSGLQANDDLEHEAAVGWLLQSSSARYVETPEPDYAALSPLCKELHELHDTAIW